MTTTTPASFKTEKLAPDLLQTTIRGDLDVQMLEQIMVQSEDLMRGEPGYISLVDISELGTVTAEARVLAKSALQRMPGFRASITIGGGFAQRMISKLLYTAMNLISKQQLLVEFCADHTAAMALVDKMRARLREENPA
jgi:hypothetical protein